MKITEKQLSSLLLVASGKNIIKLLALIPVDSGITYTDLRKQFEQMIVSGGMSRTVVYYHLKRLVKHNIVRKDKRYKTYYLTRLGGQLITLVNNFKELCMEYDLSDCDADGKIVLSGLGRKV
jgi:DNA-binding transcriptional ArsR family regulator